MLLRFKILLPIPSSLVMVVGEYMWVQYHFQVLLSRV